MKTIRHPLAVFLVDDDRVYLIALKKHLEDTFRQAVAVYLFTSGEECLKNMGKAPGVVILDYFLNGENPGSLDGLQLMNLIKRQPVRTRIIMLSAQNNMEIATSAMRHGADEYIVKSEGAFAQIEATVRNLLHSAASGQDHLSDENSEIIDVYL